MSFTIAIASKSKELQMLLMQHDYLEKITARKINIVNINEVNDFSEVSLLIIDDTSEDYNEIEHKYTMPIVYLTKLENNIANNITKRINYVSKPTRLELLFQELAKIIKGSKKTNLQIKLGEFEFSPDQQKLYYKNNVFELNDKETQLIKLLSIKKNKIVSKAKILKEVWGYSEGVDTHTLETQIYRLRQKLGDEASKLIINREGGYQLNY